MVKAFLLYLDQDSVPQCFLQIPEGAFRTLTRNLWSKAPLEIRTNNKATIGDFFERSLPNAIMPNFAVTLRCLGSAQEQKEHKFKFDSVVGLYCHGLAMMEDRLYHTPGTFTAVDFVARTTIEDEPVLVALQPTIQQTNHSTKLQAICKIPTALTASVSTIFFIVINPFWKDFNYMFDVAHGVTHGVTHGKRSFENYWYGHPQDFERIDALYEYLCAILQA